MHEAAQDLPLPSADERARTEASNASEGDPPRLLDRVRERVRYRRYSYRTEQAYVDWVRRFVRYHDRRHPRDVGAPEIASRDSTTGRRRDRFGRSMSPEPEQLGVFPAPRLSCDPRSGIIRRHHLREDALQRAIKRSARACGIAKPAAPHTLRHAFATHLLESGYDIRTVRELLEQRDVTTTMIYTLYTHVLNRGRLGVRSPLDEGA